LIFLKEQSCECHNIDFEESDFSKRRRVSVCEGGSFVMGDTWGDDFDGEKSLHEVELTYDIYIGRLLVVFDEYDGYCMEKGSTKPEDSGWEGEEGQL